VEIEASTFKESVSSGEAGVSTATRPVRAWISAPSVVTVPAAFPDAFEVLIYESQGGARLVAAIELVSPENMDREFHRRTLAVKFASRLCCQAVGLIVVSISYVSRS